jgi:PAS domain S-box-containing protein
MTQRIKLGEEKVFTGISMQHKEKTREELLLEVETLRKQVVELERCKIEFSTAEKRLRDLYENAIEGIFQTTPDGRFLSANPALARIHGYDSPEELMSSITDLAHQMFVNPDDRERLKAELERNGRVENFEIQMYRKDKSIHWVSINSKVVRDEDGKVLYYEGTLQDITSRKMAEIALKESEERYRTAIEHSNDGVAIIHGDRHLYVNRRFVEMFEFDKYEDVIGTSVLVVVHPDDHEKVREMNLKRHKGEDVPSRYEFKGLTQKGKEISIEVSAATTTYKGLSVYLIYLRDVTARKRYEEELRMERNRFQILTDSAPFGIAMVDKDGTFKYVNPKFVEIFGYDLSEVPNGRQWFRKAHPDPKYRRQVIASWIQNVKNTKPGEKVARTFEVICKDNTKKIINFIPVRLITGEHLIAFEDITERIMAHEALIKSHQELERLTRAKTKAVNHISHELKTPLSVMKGVMSLLKKRLAGIGLQKEFHELIDIFERNMNRLIDISEETDEIFTVSQEIESIAVMNELDLIWERMKSLSNMPSHIRSHWNAIKEWLSLYLTGNEQMAQSIDLYTFVLHTLKRIKTLSKNRKIACTVEGEHNLFISIDPTILKDIIEGLVKNAIENTPDGGTIRVIVEQKGDNRILKVEDYGTGITEENQQYLLDGLFHTEETDMYRSGRPYEFGAGGKGLELLRMKLYSQRFGFNITLESKRCIYIPTDKDRCPGDIALCRYCRTPDDCKQSGGTTFMVSFPVNNKGPEIDTILA